MNEDIYDYMRLSGLTDPRTSYHISTKHRRLSEIELQIVDNIGKYIHREELYHTTPFPDLNTFQSSHFTLMIDDDNGMSML